MTNTEGPMNIHEAMAAGTDRDALAGIPSRWAQPDPATLATLPKGGAQLSYMGHAEVTLALIESDPLWSWRPLSFDVDTGGPMIQEHGRRLVLWGFVSIHGKELLGVGTCEAGKGDPEKELIGDLLRNVAMRFGIGTKLWSKATDADPAGSGAAGFRRSASSGPDDRHIKSIAAHLRALGITAREDRLAKLTEITHRVISSSKDLTESEVHRVLHQLAAERKAEEDRGFNAGEAAQ